MRKRIIRVIKNNSGASIMLVLAVSMLLMFIGTSALVAASASAGASFSKHNRNQLNLYADSLQKSIMHSLQEGETGDITTVSTLGGQILNVIYQNATGSSVFATPISIDITSTISGFDGLDSTINIYLEPYVRIKEGYTSEEITEYATDGSIKATDTSFYPSEVAVSSKLTVTAVVRHRGTLTSVVTYDYAGGLLADEVDGSRDPTGRFIISNAGEWRFVSHEKIDS